MSVQHAHRSWCVFALATEREGLRLRCIGSHLAAGAAREWLDRLPLEAPWTVLASGSPYALTMQVRIPANVTDANTGRRLQHCVTDALLALRARGQLRLLGLETGAEEALGPSRISTWVANWFDVHQGSADLPGPTDAAQRVLDARDMLERASPLSVAGLLRPTRSWRALVAWAACHANPARINALCLPLLESAVLPTSLRTPEPIRHYRHATPACVRDVCSQQMGEANALAQCQIVQPDRCYRDGAGIPMTGMFVLRNRSVKVIPYWIATADESIDWAFDLLRHDHRDPALVTRGARVQLNWERFAAQRAAQLVAAVPRWCGSADACGTLPAPVQHALVEGFVNACAPLQRALRAALDPRARALAMEIHGYNELNAAGDAVLRRRRCQAIAIVPMLLPALVGGEAPRTRAAIDAAEPLWPALAADYGVPRWAVRRLRGLGRPDPDAHVARIGLGHVLRLIEALGPTAPIDAALLTQWSTLMGLIGDADRWPWLRTMLAPLVGREAAQQGWESAARSAAAVLCGSDAGAFDAYVDFLLHVIREQVPAPPDDTAALTALARKLRRCTLGAFIAHKAKLREAMAQIRVQSYRLERDRPMTPALFAAGWFGQPPAWARHLVTPGELITEGEEMQHCVGDYIPRVLAHRCVVVAFRKAREQRITADYCIGAEGRWHARQIRGAANAPVLPGHPLREAVRAVNRHLNQMLLADAEVMSPFRAAAARVVPGSSCGSTWEAPELWDSAQIEQLREGIPWRGKSMARTQIRCSGRIRST